MRLDKFIAENTGLTRSQATKAIRQSAVKINDEIVKNGATKVSQEDEIYFEDELLPWVEEGQYFMLHKPQGYVCSTDDPDHPTVLYFLDEPGYVCSHDDGDYPTIYQFFEPPLSGKLHSAGRLDVDTTGLVLLTDDGQWSHRITSPKHQCEKTYLVTLADPVENHYASACEEGILLRGEKEPTKPAKLEVLDDYNVNLTISEGRYHQVKRMFAALGNKVVGLHRWRIGNVELDESLEEGEFRPLTQEEIDNLVK